MDANQEDFLRDETFSLTLMATVRRAKVYKHGLSERERRAFQVALRPRLEDITKQYESEVAEDTHVRNSLGLSDYFTLKCGTVLKDGRFRIGAAQKALNLYLKYLWCLGKIPAPPHCPFDSQIICKLPGCKGMNWTSLDTEQEYRRLVMAAKSVANGTCLADWELQVYNNASG